MVSYKNKKVKTTIVAFVILITLLEMYLVYKITIEYTGIYKIHYFVPLISFQIYYCFLLFKKERKYLVIRAFSIGLLTIIIPVIVYITLPNYTYNEGKQNVELYLQSYTDIEFIKIPKSSDTIPTINNPKQLFVSNRLYYYKITLMNKNKYFVVSPITGEVSELSKAFWPEDIN